MNFTEISDTYKTNSIVQNNAGEILIKLMNIQKNDYVLDIGCGTGNITNRIKEFTSGEVTGIDEAEGMITEAQKNYKNIEFKTENVYNLKYKDKFDKVFCNSTFQWFKDKEKAVSNIYNSLKKGGIAGIQAPATFNYCENFVKAIKDIKINTKTAGIFKYYESPWNFMNTVKEYEEVFKSSGFKIKSADFKREINKVTVEKAFDIFSSGAIIGYLNQLFYKTELSESYYVDFKEIVKKSFENQSNGGIVELIFNRIYLIAEK